MCLLQIHKTLFVPSAGHVLQVVKHVATVVKIDCFHFRNPVGVIKLLNSEFVVVLPA